MGANEGGGEGLSPPLKKKPRIYNFKMLYCNGLLAFNIFSSHKPKVEIAST